jgi:hypothetical protein
MASMLNIEGKSQAPIDIRDCEQVPQAWRAGDIPSPRTVGQTRGWATVAGRSRDGLGASLDIHLVLDDGGQKARIEMIAPVLYMKVTLGIVRRGDIYGCLKWEMLPTDQRLFGASEEQERLLIYF